nr:immunoglobulin heavy chain junction region [Mus musculus]
CARHEDKGGDYLFAYW